MEFILSAELAGQVHREGRNQSKRKQKRSVSTLSGRLGCWHTGCRVCGLPGFSTDAPGSKRRGTY